MVAAFRIKNYITAASFAHRLLELPEVSSEKNADMKSKVRLHAQSMTLIPLLVLLARCN